MSVSPFGIDRHGVVLCFWSSFSARCHYPEDNQSSSKYEQCVTHTLVTTCTRPRVSPGHAEQITPYLSYYTLTSS